MAHEKKTASKSPKKAIKRKGMTKPPRPQDTTKKGMSKPLRPKRSTRKK